MCAVPGYSAGYASLPQDSDSIKSHVERHQSRCMRLSWHFRLSQSIGHRRRKAGNWQRMKIMDQQAKTELPAISITARDAHRLRHLAEAAMEKFPTTADFLAREIDRAEIQPNDQQMPAFVAMQSSVRFCDNTNGLSRTVTLVFPEDADVDAGKISVLTPIGAALIGLSTGQTIAFQTPSGSLRSLTVTDISWPSPQSALPD